MISAHHPQVAILLNIFHKKFSSIVQAQNRCSSPIDPMIRRLVGVQLYEHDKVWRVSCRCQHATSLCRFINWTFILLPLLVKKLFRFYYWRHGDDRKCIEENFRKWFVERVCLSIPSCSFQENPLNEEKLWIYFVV